MTYRLSFILTVIMALAASCLLPVRAHPKTAPHIAITKIISHPSLDKIEQGLIDRIRQDFPKATFSQTDAQGNITTAAQIAQNYAAQEFDLIIPITTPSAQTIRSAFRGSKTPIVFAAVTDPVGAHLVSSLEHDGERTITGVVDQPPIAQTLDLITTTLDNVTKIGVLYNAGEANSEFQIGLLREAATDKGMKVIEVPVAKASDIPMAVKSLIEDVGCLFLPNDNLVISSLDSIVKITQHFNKLIFVSDPDSVTRGAFAAVAFDQYAIGVQTGELAVHILHGHGMPALTLMVNAQVFINRDLATDKGLLERLKGLIPTEDEPETALNLPHKKPKAQRF